MRSKTSKSIFGGAFAILMAIVLVRALAGTRKDPPKEEDQGVTQQAAKAPARVSAENGKTVIKLGSKEVSPTGIVTAQVKGARAQRQITAPAVVMSIQDLVSLAASYDSAQAALAKAENDQRVTRQEYERLKSLYADHQNVSQKAVEAAEGLFRNDQTDAQAAGRNLQFQAAALRQSWGETVAKWVEQPSPEIERVLNRQDVLLQVTPPINELRAAPSVISFDLPDNRTTTAGLVSVFPRVDPRVQGVSFLYRTSATTGLAPGLNLVAHLSVGRREAGVEVPASAVVWWQGEALVYVETAPGEFTPETIAADKPLTGGFFVTTGLARGDKVVTRGAEQLLSMESNSQLPAPSGGEEGDND